MNSIAEYEITKRMLVGDFSMVKDYNENHDPSTGQFTSGGSSGYTPGQATKQRISELEKSLNKAKTQKQIQAVYRGISDEEKSINANIDRLKMGGPTDDPDDDIRLLMTHRRMLRQLKDKALKKGEQLI